MGVLLLLERPCADLSMASGIHKVAWSGGVQSGSGIPLLMDVVSPSAVEAL